MDHRRTARQLRARLLAAAGLAGGALLLTRPRQVVAALAPAFPRERLWVARLLGARLVAQHAAVLVAPRPPVLRAAAAVDALHAASMLPVLTLPRYRRAALVSGTVAASSAAMAWISGAWISGAGISGGGTRGRPPRRRAWDRQPDRARRRPGTRTGRA